MLVGLLSLSHSPGSGSTPPSPGSQTGSIFPCGAKDLYTVLARFSRAAVFETSVPLTDDSYPIVPRSPYVGRLLGHGFDVSSKMSDMRVNYQSH